MDEERQFQLAKLLSREAQRLLAQASPGRRRARPPVPKPKPDSAAGGTGLHPEETAMSKRAVIAGWSHIPSANSTIRTPRA